MTSHNFHFACYLKRSPLSTQAIGGQIQNFLEPTSEIIYWLKEELEIPFLWHYGVLNSSWIATDYQDMLKFPLSTSQHSEFPSSIRNVDGQPDRSAQVWKAEWESHGNELYHEPKRIQLQKWLILWNLLGRILCFVSAFQIPDLDKSFFSHIRITVPFHLATSIHCSNIKYWFFSMIWQSVDM